MWAALLAAVTLLAGSGTAVAVTPVTPAPTVKVRVLARWHHDTGSYTEGLVWSGGRLFESAGLYGHSSVREVQPRTGRVLRRRALASRYFGEGLALHGDRLIQLTWKEGVAFVWGRDTFSAQGRFGYTGEGWGLATFGRRLVMSDGTATLRFLDPATFRVVRRVTVTDAGQPVTQLNELEVVRGEVWANVYQTDDVVVIDPATGSVRARLDLTPLRAYLDPGRRVDVLNGIAWDRSRDRVLLTGKWWPWVFEASSRV